MNDSDRRLYGGPYAHDENQIVVGLPHLKLVLDELRDVGVAHKVVRTSSLLDLALVELPRSDLAADALVPYARGLGPRLPSDRIGVVLDGLRGRFGTRYAGWSPTLGKNRTVGQLHGAQEVIHSGGDPVALGAPLAPPARSTGPGRGVRVGLLDTGLFCQPWLSGGWSARYSDQLSSDRVHPFAAGHATFVAGLILSQAGGATVECRRVFEDKGTAESWTVGEEIVRMGRSGLDVLNLSFACYTEDGQPPLVLATAVDRIDPDVVVVAAAGNHGDVRDRCGSGDLPGPQSTKPAWPAALDDVVAVGAADADGRRRAHFSPDAPWVDVHAAGVDVRSTYLDQASDRPGGRPRSFPGGWARWNGTSFAAGLVSGAVAASTEPGRVPASDSAQELLGALRTDGPAPLDDTEAPFLRLPLW